MPVRKLKPVEANDGSYAGLVLAAFDKLEAASGLTRDERTHVEMMRKWCGIYMNQYADIVRPLIDIIDRLEAIKSTGERR